MTNNSETDSVAGGNVNDPESAVTARKPVSGGNVRAVGRPNRMRRLTLLPLLFYAVFNAVSTWLRFSHGETQLSTLIFVLICSMLTILFIIFPRWAQKLFRWVVSLFS